MKGSSREAGWPYLHLRTVPLAAESRKKRTALGPDTPMLKRKRDVC